MREFLSALPLHLTLTGLPFSLSMFPNSSVHRIGTRQATRGDLFKSIKNTTLYGLQTIQYFGSKLWNTLPLFIRVASSIAVFRSKLKSYFLDSYSQN